MKIIYPPKDGYVQTNRSNLLGSLWATFNIDLQSNLGAVRIGTKMRVNTSTVDSSHLGLPIAFKEFDARLWSVCQQWVFKSNGTNSTLVGFVEDMSTGVVTTYSIDASDLEVFNGQLVAVNTTNIYTKVSNGAGTGAWTDRGALVSSGYYHKLCYFKKFDRLYYIFDATHINSADTSWSIASGGNDYSINLAGNITRISTMVATSDDIWIGTLREYNSASSYDSIEKCAIYQWDGISQQVIEEFLIDAQGILAMTIRNNIPYIMDSNGVLRAYTGSYFKEVGRLPLNKELLYNATVSNVDRFIHPNGMITTKNNTIQILIKNNLGDNTGSLKENLPSGIWEWSEQNGFVHLNPLTYTTVFSPTITDYGQNKVSGIGALANANIYNNSSSGRATIIAGSNYFTDATTIISAIFIDSPIPTDNANTPEGQKKGYFITTFFLTSEIESKWERLWNIHKQFLNSTDSIVFKYRLYEQSPLQATITWVDTTHFTTTTDVTGYWTSGTGEEVEILQGTGGGNCAHITSIVNNAGTYTVTLDEIITGVTTGTAIARFQHWVKLNPKVSGTIKQWEQMSINANASMIQIKCCLTWTGDAEFLRMALVSNEDITISK